MAGLGAELRRLWERPPSVSRPVKGWHAQISALTKTSRGYEAAEKVGLHVQQRRTLEGWLSQTHEPNARNKSLINAAYRYMIGGWDASVQNRTYSISGDIDSGDRTQNRELIIDGSAGDWQPIIDAFLNGASDQELERLFIEHVIVEDIGEGSRRPGMDDEFGWAFPGTDYQVLI
jgi:hypothetical protein